MGEVRQAIVVGAGPAGMAAAIYLQRAGLSPLLLEMGEPGGLLREANLVENYPGFPGGIRGADMAALMVKQARDVGVTIARERAERISLRKGKFVIKTDRKERASRTLIVATGTRPRTIRLKGASDLTGKRLFYGINSIPGKGLRGSLVLVVGGGDAAFDYGLSLRGKGCKVTILTRSSPRCLPLLQARAEQAGIEVRIGFIPRSVSERRGRVVLSCSHDRKLVELVGDYVLVACGREPNLELLRDSDLGVPIARGGPPMTNVPGLFLVGDAVRENCRQTGIAVGDGILAAMLAERYVKGGKRE
ncbi:MAG: NAD(P)/FAD-dependent oxidoreductase [Thermoplasmatota archaeon]